MGGVLATDMCKRVGIGWADIQEELKTMSKWRDAVKERNVAAALEEEHLAQQQSEPLGDQQATATQAGTLAWQHDVEFMSWVLQLEKVPNRNMRQMREWFHWQSTRANAVFSEGVGGGDEELEASSATLEAGASHSWAASWRPAREVFASLFWDDHAFGGFTTDLCWSGGTDALKPYLGAPSVGARAAEQVV